MADIETGTVKGSSPPPVKSSGGHSHAAAGQGERGKIKRRELIGVITSERGAVIQDTHHDRPPLPPPGACLRTVRKLAPARYGAAARAG